MSSRHLVLYAFPRGDEPAEAGGLEAFRTDLSALLERLHEGDGGER